MNRFFARTLATGLLLAAGTAAAHPGHGTPHLLHPSDLGVGWAIGIACAVAVGFVLARRKA